jgi:hypothetical protein
MQKKALGTAKAKKHSTIGDKIKNNELVFTDLSQ